MGGDKLLSSERQVLQQKDGSRCVSQTRRATRFPYIALPIVGFKSGRFLCPFRGCGEFALPPKEARHRQIIGGSFGSQPHGLTVGVKGLRDMPFSWEGLQRHGQSFYII